VPTPADEGGHGAALLDATSVAQEMLDDDER
jgi:hypothetical protein